MIAANELRIGNWVSNVNGHLEFDFDCINELENLSSIELTEEWLKKFRFETNFNGFYFKDRFNIYKPVDWVNFCFCEGTQILREVKYIHTLQNLYFALTGLELTIKE